ncbi:hypothetical protein AAG906_032934 [Vitis piasezkii]
MILSLSHHVGLWNESNELFKGLRFESKEDLQYLCKRYAICRNQHLVVCESEPQLWARLRACRRKSHGMFEITKYAGPHTCVYPKLSQDHSQLDSTLIAREIQNVVQRDHTTSIATLHQIVKDKFGYDVHYRRIWEAKRKAMLRVFGDWDESYQALPKWMNILQLTNPGTKIVWKTIPLGGISGNVRFMRVFWAFGASVEGFKHCRPIIQIDGTFLYGKYMGKLLIATSIDGNGHVFPLAFAIVEEESQDSWSWFLIALRHHVTQREGICLISDRHAGINAAVRNPSVGWSPPHAQHRYYLRHVVSNFNDKFKNKVLKELAYRAGCQHQPRKYERYMEELKRLDEKSVAWFSKLDTQNALMGCLRVRMLPITALVQLTFYRCVSYFETRRAEIRARMAVGDVYTAYAIEKFRRAEAKASGHTVTIFHRIHETFEVITALHGFHMDKGRNKQVVKLNEGTCSCNKWQSFGIPCSHVLAVSAHMRIDSWQLVEKYYRLDAYASCYAPEFNPIPHESYWSYHRTMEPGPLDPTVLHGQATHRSSVAWTGVDSKELHCRRREAIFHRTSVLDGRIIPLLQQAGFYGVARLGFISLDWHLITAFVERWRLETHTFHLPQGECTITLQDIAMLIGLPVDGDVVTGSTCLDWRRVCYSLLGLTPGDTDIDGQRLHLTWLSQSFPTLAPDADEESIQRYTRAYILQLIGGFLFSGKSSDKVHLMFLPFLEDFEVVGRYSWGSACLAWLYRQLCRASHIDTHDISAHRFCSDYGWRDEFRTTSISMHILIIGQPYVDHMNVGLPIIVFFGKDIWCTISPLICFHIIEWHRPDRVLRQFGFCQGIPQPCDNESSLHKCDLRGRDDVDWTTRHGDYIRHWSSKREHIARDEMAIGSLGYHDPYMVWYRSITIRFLTRTGSFHELLLCTLVLEAIHEMDRLDALFSVDATTLQPPSEMSTYRMRASYEEIRHTPVVARVRPSTDISPPPHQQPTSSITRSGGVRTRGGGPHTRSSPPPHQPISSITRSGGVRTRGGGPHTRSSPPPHQQPISPITRSGGVRTRGGGPHTRSSPPPHQQPISPITRSGDAPSADISLPLLGDSYYTYGGVIHSTVVPLVASSPPSIEATLVHEELVHIENDDQQRQKTNRGRGHAHGGLHVSPIEPIVEHAHHRHPLRKRKAPSCGTH